jgi:hypothetical protein
VLARHTIEVDEVVDDTTTTTTRRCVMVATTRVRAVLLAVLALAMVNCGSDEDTAAPPTAEELATTLITVDDYDGDWTVNTGPEGSVDVSSGVVPDEVRALLPGIELCDEAGDESRAAADDLQWMAFRQLDLTVEDPIQPPDRTGHMVFVQEFLTSAPAHDVETTFGLLRDGLEACLGDIPAGEEGPGTAEEMPLPEVGDERYGVLTTIEEAGGWAEWRIHGALVRQGPILAWIQVVDIRAGEGVEPYYTIDEVGDMVQTAIDKL